MPSVEFVRLASHGEHVCVQLELVQLELTANRISRDYGDADCCASCAFISDSIFPHDITRYEAKKEEWRCVWTRVSSNPSVIRRIWQIGRRVSVASEGVGRARGMCWRHLDREGHGRSPFLRWTSLGLDMAHERTIHTPWNAPGAAPRVQSRQETLHTRGRRVAFRRALVGSDVAQYVGFAGRQAAPG